MSTSTKDYTDYSLLWMVKLLNILWWTGYAQTEQFNSHGQTSSDFTQTPKNTYQTQPDAYTDIYAYTDPAVTDFSRIFSITVNSLWIGAMLTKDFGLVRLCTDWFFVEAQETHGDSISGRIHRLVAQALWERTWLWWEQDWLLPNKISVNKISFNRSKLIGDQVFCFCCCY